MMPLFCQDVVDTGLADTLDLVSLQLRAAAEEIAQANRQVRVLDIYALSAVSSHNRCRVSLTMRQERAREPSDHDCFLALKVKLKPYLIAGSVHRLPKQKLFECKGSGFRA